jgi:uncharacterized membrane protein
MALVERDIVINAPMDAIYSFGAVPDNLPQWYVGITAVNADGVWPEVGGQVGVTYHASGIDFELTLTVLTHDPPTEFSFQMDGMVTGTSTWRYTDEGGGTHAFVAFDYDLPGGVLGQMADKLVVEQMNIENGEQSLSNLKAICEGR